MLPFNNDMKQIEISEKDLVDVINAMAGSLLTTNSDPQVLRCAGMNYTIHNDVEFAKTGNKNPLIDLKIGEITHQDLGQMQMYVNYYDRFVKLDHENKTIGIILCKKKSDSLVEITLPENNNQIFASKYQTVLPNKEDLIKLIQSGE